MSKTRMMRDRYVGALMASFLVALAAGCGPGDRDEEAPSDTTGMAGEMEGMGGMEGMAGMQGGMMEQMRGHMDHMAALPADSLQPMLATHRQMVGNMLSRMNREMSQMGMAADTAWDATVDSLRSDLTRMPTMSGQELAPFMQAHHARVMRLMEMHEEMMRGMDGGEDP